MNRTPSTRALFVLLATALLALGAAACGGGSSTTDESSPTTAAEAPATDTTDQSQGEDQGSTEKDGTGQGGDTTEKAEPQQGGGQGSDGGRQQEDQPEAEAGEPESESQQSEPAAKGIRGFGAEASAAERETVSDLVEGFLQGREDKEWKVVCAAAAKPVIAPLERLAARNPQLKGSGCVALLTLVGKQNSAPDFESNMAGPVTSFRVKGKRGFAIYNGTGGGNFAMPMLSEGGDWKVGSFEARELS